MSYKSLCRKLIRQDFPRYKRWSTLKNRTNKSLRKNAIINMLEVISGGDLNGLLDDISGYRKYYKALENIGFLFDQNKIEKNFSPYVKRKIIRMLRLGGLIRSEAKQLGFKCSKYLWKKCLTMSKPKKRGRKNIPNDLQLAIQDHMETLSKINVNRLIKTSIVNEENIKQKIDVPVKLRSETLQECYKSFPFNESLGFITFYKYIDKKFKKYSKFSDLCRICEFEKILKNRIINKANQLKFVSKSQNACFDIEEFKIFFQNLEM
jgi:hypothetical protein